MFPEIAGAACIEAAIAAFNHQPQPELLLTPYTIMSQETLESFYSSAENGWELRIKNAQFAHHLPFNLAQPDLPSGWSLPRRIGFVQRFREHEWYQNLIKAMIERAEIYGIELELADSEQTLRDEIELRRQEIARRAIKEISKGDSILVDHGPAGMYLAQELLKLQDITVITNSTSVFRILENNPNLILVSTGGVLRRATNTLVGPSAEAMLRDLRASKLFLQAEGVSLEYGLSHSNLSEVTIKQKMIQSAHQVILLADHTCFGKEVIGQIAPLSAVHKLISDDALPASYRLEASGVGVEVVVAEVN
jgi:DeoR/GlpR family transcriptional regulator of sugar metabolism